ncbi:MAG: YidC/Oxa1 family membrane protein insertase, partial [Lachnospiraceae bacterium]|nr:YidC/Oxa1 family membrane protein insertase [Lachnospiraceae bacterium]
SFLGPIAKLLGWVMDKIYLLFDSMGIQSIALTIIVFTIIVYVALFPLTYKQQKFSVLSRKMNPELKKIQEKYKGKKDQASMTAQQEETQALYDKYGVSMTGSCVQMLIQMPILFALYRVFYNVPAYITSVKDVFTDLVAGIQNIDGYQTTMQTLYENANIRNVAVDFTADDKTTLGNYIIDVVYKFSASGWDSLKEAFPTLSDTISSTYANLNEMNNLFVLSISDTPLNQIKLGYAEGNWALIIAAIAIPVIATITQYLSILQMPTNDSNDQMSQQMKTMNYFMPLMTFFIGFTCPVGLGLYWAAGGFIRAGQQFFLNRHFEKIDLNQIIEANKEKAAKKKEKRGIRREQIMANATMNTKRTMSDKASYNNSNSDALEKAAQSRSTAKAGSLAAKANLVKDFNEGKTNK